MKVIIAGSRHIKDPDLLKRAIEASGFQITEVVSGGCKGPDRLGEFWAHDNNIPCKRFLPDWNIAGRRAGLERNIEMAKYAEALIALWDGRSYGTAHMIWQASKHNLKISVFETERMEKQVFAKHKAGSIQKRIFE